jgi:hypothetical protein
MATLANKAQQQFVFQHVSFIIMLLQTVALRAHAGAHTVNACIPVCVYVSENPNRNKPWDIIANAGGICQTRRSQSQHCSPQTLTDYRGAIAASHHEGGKATKGCNC